MLLQRVNFTYSFQFSVMMRTSCGKLEKIMKFAVYTALGLVFILSTLSVAMAAPPPGLAKYQAARAEFDSMVADAKAGKGDLPRLSDPKAAEVLRILSDADGVLGTQTYGWGDFFPLLDVCNTTPGVAYSQFDMGPLDYSSDVPITPAGEKEQEDAARKNRIVYQDEVIPLIEFSLACHLRLLPLLEEMGEFLKRGGISYSDKRGMIIRVKGMQVRSMVRFSSLVLGLNRKDSEIRPENARRLLKAGARMADAYAVTFTERQRAFVIRKAQKVRPDLDSAAQTDLDIIVKAMQRAECEGLCSY